MPRRTRPQVIAAIDVGTNAVRLEIARLLPKGGLEVLHQERDPVRPGEGVFSTGGLPRPVADRLLSTLSRYAALCRRFKAEVRAVATSAVREANNREEVVQRARDEAGLELEVISGKEEARLICLGVLNGRSEDDRSLLIDIGGGSTEVVLANGESPRELWSVPVGAVRLTEVFDAKGKVGDRKLEVMRAFADEAFREVLKGRTGAVPQLALGSSGTINTVVAWAAAGGTRASVQQLTKAVEKLASLSLAQKRQIFDERRAEIIVGGAVVLEQAMKHLGAGSIVGVSSGLRDGVLVDLVRRRGHVADASLGDAALVFARRFGVDETHARHITRLALQLFDALLPLHKLPEHARPLLEAAALLHDVGYAVNPQRHHKHTEYLVRNADIPGLTDHERELVALIARFHRRSAPERSHSSLALLPSEEFQLVRRASTLLRFADAFDRSHQQPVRSLEATLKRGTVALCVNARAPVDLELWDAEREAPLFHRVFRRPVEMTVRNRADRKAPSKA